MVVKLVVLSYSTTIHKYLKGVLLYIAKAIFMPLHSLLELL